MDIAFHECPVCCYFAAAQEWQRLTARLAESNLLLRSLVGMAQNWRWIVFMASSNWPWQWVEAVPLSLLHALLNQERTVELPALGFSVYLSHLVPFWSRHSAPRCTKDTWGRRSPASVTKRGSKFASGPRCGRRRWCAPSRELPLGVFPAETVCRGHPGPKRQWWGQMMPDGGVVLIVWWCSMFCVVPNRKLGKRRLNVFVVFLPKGIEMWYSKIAFLCIFL